MTQLAVVGCGYVGTVTAACLAHLGHSVECIDVDEDRIAVLNEGRSPIHEPGLDALIREGLDSGRLQFRHGYPERFRAEIAFIAVNTPGSQEGAADLRAVRDAVASVARALPPGSIIVNKSTVPIGTGDLVEGMAERSGSGPLSVVSNPEFLREGAAVADFFAPDRVVLGSKDPEASARVAALYDSLDAPILLTDIRTAEMIKYASNAFLATKISFINEMAAICESVGADVQLVAAGMGADERIGERFLEAGLGWGGSCFPKDVRALVHIAATRGTNPQLLRSVIEINADQRLRAVRKLREGLGSLEGRRVLLLGAAFKQGTDDLRNSPALELAELLRHEGAHVAIYDPIIDSERIRAVAPEIATVETPLGGATGADAVVVATDWPEFAELPLGEIARAMRHPLLLDGRNCLDPDAVRGAGLEYLCIGRPTAEGPGAAPEPARLHRESVAVGS